MTGYCCVSALNHDVSPAREPRSRACIICAASRMCRPLRQVSKPRARVVIIGGGYIGLETAATGRKMGCEVTVLEMADRIMNRVVAPSVSQYFAAEHVSHGVNIICDTRVVCLEGRDRVERVVCADGSSHAADLVVVGVGAVAATD